MKNKVKMANSRNDVNSFTLDKFGKRMQLPEPDAFQKLESTKAQSGLDKIIETTLTKKRFSNLVPNSPL